uniref:Uncharacterized protein n=1 Tax=Physcomitrium patens TaxID=3218 RepID=A0A2K1IF51_PHYPA|nr:hypothetical protein PHYPA_028495 [Physcomitrium patens]
MCFTAFGSCRHRYSRGELTGLEITTSGIGNEVSRRRIPNTLKIHTKDLTLDTNIHNICLIRDIDALLYL